MVMGTYPCVCQSQEDFEDLELVVLTQSPNSLLRDSIAHIFTPAELDSIRLMGTLYFDIELDCRCLCLSQVEPGKELLTQSQARSALARRMARLSKDNLRFYFKRGVRRKSSAEKLNRVMFVDLPNR